MKLSNMTKKLNIIIPMYNAEAFIERTVHSIVQSNLPSDFYDILIVNDGSTDRSRVIVEGMMKTIPNLRLINQENGGSSVARNTGIENSDSDYIWFVDSDDMVESDLSIIQELLLNFPEVEVFDFELNWVNDKNEVLRHESSHPTVIHNKIIQGRDAIMQGYAPGSVCGLILKRSFLNESNLRFKVGITQQDVELTYKLFACAKKVMFRYEVIYNYLIRQNSISKALDVKRKIKYESDKIEIIASFRNLAKSFENTDEELSLKIWDYAGRALFGCVYNLYLKRKELIRNGIIDGVVTKMNDAHLLPLSLSSYSWKKKLIILYLNHWIKGYRKKQT